MMGLISVLSTLLLGVGASGGGAEPALSLEVSEADGQVEVHLVGKADRALKVSYTLEVTGQSSSTHRGSTALQAGSRSVLVSAGKDWCARLSVTENGGDSYEIVEGTCV